MKARTATIDKAIDRTEAYKFRLEYLLATDKRTYYRKDSPRKIDISREEAILRTLRGVRRC